MTDLATPDWADLEAPTGRPPGVTASEFRRRFVAKEPTDGLCFMKRMVTKRLEKGDNRELRAVTSASTLDLENDVVSVKGTDLKFYRTNPILLPNHDRTALPIGVAVKLAKVVDELRSTFRYAPPEVSALADSFYQNHLWRMDQKALGDSGAMFSIYANPKRAADAMDFDAKRGGMNFNKQVLWEQSDVTIGAQQRAQLLKSAAAGVPMEPVLEWALGIVKDDDSLLVLECAEADRIVKTLDPLKGLEVFEISAPAEESPDTEEEPPAWARSLVGRIAALEKAPKEPETPEPKAPEQEAPAAPPEPDVDAMADMAIKRLSAALTRSVGVSL